MSRHKSICLMMLCSTLFISCNFSNKKNIEISKNDESIKTIINNVSDTIKYKFRNHKLIEINLTQVESEKIYRKKYFLNNNLLEKLEYNVGNFGLGVMKNESDNEKFITLSFLNDLESNKSYYVKENMNIDVFFSKINNKQFINLYKNFSIQSQKEQYLIIKQSKPIKLYDTKTFKIVKEANEIVFDYIRDVKILKDQYFSKISLYSFDNEVLKHKEYFINLKEINSYVELAD